MERIVVDTDILIDYVRGEESARLFLESLAAESRCTTVVNVLELFQGAFNKFDLKKLDGFVRDCFHVLMLTPQSCSKAIEMIRRYSLSNGLRSGDAMIAAIAVENGAVFATGNRKHFAYISSLRLLDFPVRTKTRKDVISDDTDGLKLI
jgi:predicted nucleic acid-binding protein